MFDKNKFALILKDINTTYDSQRDFSKKSGINRTYLSQYMNMKLEEPPKPKILDRLANASNGITNYQELMQICGYMNAHALYKTVLEDKLKELDDYYLDQLCSIELNHEEDEVFNDMDSILLDELSSNTSINDISDAITKRFEDIDFLSNVSKQKVKNKLLLFFKYLENQMQLREEIQNVEDLINKETKKEIVKSNNYNIQFSKNVDTSTETLTNLNKIQFINNITNNTCYPCPVYGQISAGQPNWAEECLEGYLPIDPNLMNIVDPEECFFLRVNGESMNKLIRNGAYALVRKQDVVENGEIAVVLVNGYDATLKKFTRQNDLVILEPMSNDPSFTTQVYAKDTEIKILGKYIGKFEMNS